MEENKRKQTLESAQHRLEIIFKKPRSNRNLVKKQKLELKTFPRDKTQGKSDCISSAVR